MEKVYTEHLDPHAVVMVIATTFERLTLQPSTGLTSRTSASGLCARSAVWADFEITTIGNRSRLWGMWKPLLISGGLETRGLRSNDG